VAEGPNPGLQIESDKTARRRTGFFLHALSGLLLGLRKLS